MDACFSAKRFKTSGEQVHTSWLDGLFYIPTPESIRRETDFSESCSNFRAGDVRLKAGSDVDVSAIFAAVCVHGFVYRMIGKLLWEQLFINCVLDVAKGEAMEYSTLVVKEFKKEFPNANLVVAYDIACRMKPSLTVLFIIFSLCPYTYLGKQYHCLQNVHSDLAFILSQS